MQLLLYASLNKLRFNLLHNSRLSIIKSHCLIVIGIWMKKKKKRVNIMKYYFKIIIKKPNIK
jgi:hypothetical protein